MLACIAYHQHARFLIRHRDNDRTEFDETGGSDLIHDKKISQAALVPNKIILESGEHAKAGYADLTEPRLTS